MVDINKAISDIETMTGRELTDTEKKTTTLLGELMNLLWEERPKDSPEAERTERDKRAVY